VRTADTIKENTCTSRSGHWFRQLGRDPRWKPQVTNVALKARADRSRHQTRTGSPIATGMNCTTLSV